MPCPPAPDAPDRGQPNGRQADADDADDDRVRPELRMPVPFVREQDAARRCPLQFALRANGLLHGSTKPALAIPFAPMARPVRIAGKSSRIPGDLMRHDNPSWNVDRIMTVRSLVIHLQ